MAKLQSGYLRFGYHFAEIQIVAVIVAVGFWQSVSIVKHHLQSFFSGVSVVKFFLLLDFVRISLTGFPCKIFNRCFRFEGAEFK